ncbi:MAG: nucleotidyltransferase family protein [Haloarculaceae archaeon]
MAAGMGTRFEGGNKLLAEIDGEPIVRRAARTLVESSVSEVVAVLGHQADAVEDAIQGLGLALRYNDRYEEGQSTSVAVGVDAARERGWDAAVFALGDMPFVDRESVDRLVRAYVKGAGRVLAPEHDGTRGNPVLFDSQHFDALADVTGDRGGREIVASEGTLVPVDDAGVLYDIDRRDDI